MCSVVVHNRKHTYMSSSYRCASLGAVYVILCFLHVFFLIRAGVACFVAFCVSGEL